MAVVLVDLVVEQEINMVLKGHLDLVELTVHQHLDLLSMYQMLNLILQ